ncbi:MAG: hypothetical protein QW035_04360 [Candidatus Anstonellales archaeon]
MRILKQDKNKNLTVLLIDTPDDLWYLSKILKKGDKVSGTTFRTIALESGEKDRKKVWVELILSSIKFQKYSNELTLTGEIIAGSPEEYVQKGRQQNINLRVEDSIGIVKEWGNYEKDLLKRAVESAKRKVAYAVLLDDRSAYCCWLREIGIEEDAPIYLEGSKRAGDYEKKQKEFFDELYKRISDKEIVIVGGPGFSASQFLSYIEQKKKPPIIQAKASSADITGLRELISNNPNLLKEASALREDALLQQFLLGLQKGGVVYGLEEVKNAVEQKNVKLILVHHSLLEESQIRDVLERAEREAKAEVAVLSDSPAGDQLKHFGIVAFLYY